MIDGFDMDKLFTRQQAAPTTILSTMGSDASLVAISAAMTIISSKNAARSVDNDKDELIDYNNMPTYVCERYNIKNDPFKIIANQHLTNFSNKLTIDKSIVQQDWNFVEYPKIGTTILNHPGQTYQTMKDSTLFGHLQYQG